MARKGQVPPRTRATGRDEVTASGHARAHEAAGKERRLACATPVPPTRPGCGQPPGNVIDSIDHGAARRNATRHDSRNSHRAELVRAARRDRTNSDTG